jgi:hypothetical protein
VVSDNHFARVKASYGSFASNTQGDDIVKVASRNNIKVIKQTEPLKLVHNFEQIDKITATPMTPVFEPKIVSRAAKT